MWLTFVRAPGRRVQGSRPSSCALGCLLGASPGACCQAGVCYGFSLEHLRTAKPGAPLHSCCHHLCPSGSRSGRGSRAQAEVPKSLLSPRRKVTGPTQPFKWLLPGAALSVRAPVSTSREGPGVSESVGVCGGAWGVGCSERALASHPPAQVQFRHVPSSPPGGSPAYRTGASLSVPGWAGDGLGRGS